MTRTRTPRRRAGCIVGLVLAVLVLVGGPLLADRVLHGLTEDAAADAVRVRLDAGAMNVDIEGFPFLTQLARGTLDDVRLQAPDATLHGLALTDLDVRATGVEIHEPRGAEHATVTATLPASTLQSLLRERTGWDLTLSIDGSSLVAGGDLAGVPASVHVDVAPAGPDGLTATITEATLGGFSIDAGLLPDGLGTRLTEFGLAERLPAGTSITAATVRPDGLHVTFELTDVTLDDL